MPYTAIRGHDSGLRAGVGGIEVVYRVKVRVRVRVRVRRCPSAFSARGYKNYL